jgi:hypothetical protein
LHDIIKYIEAGGMFIIKYIEAGGMFGWLDGRLSDYMTRLTAQL